MKSYFTVVDGIFTNTNKCQVLLSELNTVVGDGWGRQRGRMMNCTFRFKWGMKIISNTSRSRWWCKHLTSLFKTSAARHGAFNDTPQKENRTHGWRTSGKQVRKEHLLPCKVKLNFDASGHSFKILLTNQFIWSTGNSDRFYLFVDPGHLAALNTHLLLRDEADDSSEAPPFLCLFIEIVKQNVIIFSLRSDSWLWTRRHTDIRPAAWGEHDPFYCHGNCKVEKLSIKCGPDQRISVFFHPAQQENGLCCHLSEDFVHWLCLPLSPLEFLHMKKKRKIEMQTKPPRCWRRWAVPGLVSRHNKIFEKALTCI